MARTVFAACCLVAAVHAFAPPQLPAKTNFHTSASASQATRKAFVEYALAAAIALPSLPALADSTGKFSTKATAKKRYLPRIKKAIQELDAAKKGIDAGDWAAVTLATDGVADAISAFDLYGSAMKRGEYPDKYSKALQKEADEFAAKVKGMARAAAAKEKAAALASYSEAAGVLSAYLAGAELEPLGSKEYTL